MIDFFRFPVISRSETELFRLDGVDLRVRLKELDSPRVSHAMMALFDSGIVERREQTEMIAEWAHSGDYSFAYMPEVEGRRGEGQVDAAAAMGCRAVVFHPYLQQIGLDRLGRVQALSKRASSHGMFSCICAAYGSRDIYRYRPLEFVVAVAEVIEQPVVVVHGGGAKVLEAFLIAEAFPHVYLDTSFSLHYWLGSPIEDAFAFAIRRLGAQRWMFGSDAPFNSLAETIESHQDFCQRHGFGPYDVEQLLEGTAATVLGL